ncbi:MAG: hypothetical protein LJE91_14865, partial [Gammaproteobacteria bacterium]|nr:hypothetical protein [Gammaproteobacteria bacterium]
GGFTDLFRPDGVGFDLQWGGIAHRIRLVRTKNPSKIHSPRQMSTEPRRLPENDIPDRAGFPFVVKTRQQAHSRTMERLS